MRNWKQTLKVEWHVKSFYQTSSIIKGKGRPSLSLHITPAHWVEGLFHAWTMVLFTKISYQHQSDCKGICANMQPYDGEQWWRRNKWQVIFSAMVTSAISCRITICISIWDGRSLSWWCSLIWPRITNDFSPQGSFSTRLVDCRNIVGQQKRSWRRT